MPQVSAYEFGPFRLEVAEHRLLQNGRPVPLRAKLFEALLMLVRRHGRLLEKGEFVSALWPDAVVEEGNLSHTISILRKTLGESATGQRYVETVPKTGYRFIADVREVTGNDGHDSISGNRRLSTVDGCSLQQEIRFCRTADGVRIASATVGEGPPLIQVANCLSHLEFGWRSPVWSHLLEALARDHQFIRFDARGCGLSDWDVDDISFEGLVRDLEAVIDAAAVTRCALFGTSQGCAVSIAYAVRHPERVSHLVLHGGYARGWRLLGSPEMLRRTEALAMLMEDGWGRANHAIHQFFTALYLPEGTPEQTAWFNELQRVSMSSKNAVRLRDVVGGIDVSGLLGLLDVPTLVFHSVHDEAVPFACGRALASGIRDARFIPLQSWNHVILEHEPAWPVFRDEVRRFLADGS